MSQAMRDSIEMSTSLLIDGEFREGSSGVVADLNPATEKLIAEVAAAGADDVDLAVTAARRAFEGEWARTPAATRGRLLNDLATLVERDLEILATLEALDVGRPIMQPRKMDVPNAVATLRYFAGWADKVGGEVISTPGYFGRPTHSYTVREPIGVVGAIVPWNTPLMLATWKLAAALAVGNTVVVKPPEDAPLSILHLARLVCEAGLPPGVVNVVPGLGEIAGEALVAHADVDKISFTGSTEVGRRIASVAGQRFARTTLELGGKSPQIICADADVKAAIRGTAMGLFANQGELCCAGTRVLVHRSHYDKVVAALAEVAEAQVVGDPFDPATTIGALVNARQHERVQAYIADGQSSGARMVAGGDAPSPGYFVRPTIFADATNDMRIAREEIFGPVGTVIPFDDMDEAIAIANDTIFGLSASIWTRDVSTAHSLARRVKAGCVWVNGWGAFDPALPWGGVKDSGIGRELGWSAIVSNTEEKVVTVLI